jgi:hypothetical protein
MSAKFAGVEFFARRHIKRPAVPAIRGATQMFDYKTKRQFQAMITGTAQGLDFKTVVSFFGPGWRENRDAENNRDTAIAREPFNPPQPQPTVIWEMRSSHTRRGYRAINKMSLFNLMEGERYAKSIASLCTKTSEQCSGADVTKLSLWASLPRQLAPPAIGRWLEPTSISDAVMHLSTCAISMGLSREPVASK